MPIDTNILKIFYSISSFVFCCFPLPSQPSGLPESSRGSSHATPPDQRPPPHRTPAGVPGISGAPACSRLCAPEPNQRPGTNTKRSGPFHPGSAPFLPSAFEISAFPIPVQRTPGNSPADSSLGKPVQETTIAPAGTAEHHSVVGVKKLSLDLAQKSAKSPHANRFALRPLARVLLRRRPP